MACIRKRRGKWGLDYRDGAGGRHWKTCATRGGAELWLSRIIPESRQWRLPRGSANLTLDDYAPRWLTVIAASVKPRTLASYRQMLQTHLLPTLGAEKLRTFSRGQLRRFFSEKLAGGLSRNTVRIMHATLRGLLQAAV